MLDRFKHMAADVRSALTPTTLAKHRGDPVNRQPASITFRVDDVTPAGGPLWMSTLRESLELRSGSKILIMPESELPALAPEGYFVPGTRAQRAENPNAGHEPLRRMKVPFRAVPGAGSDQDADRSESDALLKRMANRTPMLHPLLQAIHLAFSQHRPLILSPDGIWLAIVQGFGHHVHENAEALRDRVVSHEGKKDLVVEAASLAVEHWPLFTAQFSAAIRGNSNEVLYETLMCRFSTTTPSIQTAMEIALMDVYERYFNYILVCVCGIPKITLQGTPADWRRMRERIEVLATYDLGWWTSRLAPILDEFVATAEGHPDRRFWQAIYKPKEAYGGEVASGWITDLFPYLGERPKRRRNEMIGHARENWILVNPKSERPPMFHAGVGLDSFPSGLSRAPVKIKAKDSGSEIEIDLVGGFAGVGQQTDDCALFPIISWAVAERFEERPPVAPSRSRDHGLRATS
jgi:hypothetical protein